MLRSLSLEGVGPAARLALDPLGSRLNLITGDNGLGKSFLLDIAWWALTGTWAGYPALPAGPEAKILWSFHGNEPEPPRFESAGWERVTQHWLSIHKRPAEYSLVIYARMDGSFSVWDPARNRTSRKLTEGRSSNLPHAFHFSPTTVMDGLRSEEGGILCRGLIDDWTRWQGADRERFSFLERLLVDLSEDPAHPMRPGPSRKRFLLNDIREIPTIHTEYGEDVPLLYAGAGTQRVVRLVYLLTWVFMEHVEAATALGLPVATETILLIDEPETHLHPRWQRRFLPALLNAAQGPGMSGAQILSATHSPLVLASVESLFEPARDALWKLDLVQGEVKIERDQWRKRGNVGRWLISDVFDLAAATSVEAEAAMRDAGRLMKQATPEPAEIEKVDAALLAALPEMDPFFLRWRHVMAGHFGEAAP